MTEAISDLASLAGVTSSDSVNFQSRSLALAPTISVSQYNIIIIRKILFYAVLTLQLIGSHFP